MMGILLKTTWFWRRRKDAISYIFPLLSDVLETLNLLASQAFCLDTTAPQCYNLAIFQLLKKEWIILVSVR